MQVGYYKGKHKVKVHLTKEDGKDRYIVEFENGASVTFDELSPDLFDEELINDFKSTNTPQPIELNEDNVRTMIKESFEACMEDFVTKEGVITCVPDCHLESFTNLIVACLKQQKNLINNQ